jgi:hypothetical protein
MSKGKGKPNSGDWPPIEFALPADDAAIEQGRAEGRQIEDLSRAARLRRLMKQWRELAEKGRPEKMSHAATFTTLVEIGLTRSQSSRHQQEPTK